MKGVKQYYIKPIKRGKWPKDIIFIDAETNINDYEKHQEHTFKIAWTCYLRLGNNLRIIDEHYRFWVNPWMMHKYIEETCKRRKELYLFAHNIFYDLQCSSFFEYFQSWGWEYDFLYDKGLTYILVIKKNKSKLISLSSTNFFPFSAKKLGELLNLPKLKIDFKEDNITKLAIYCKRDVEIIVKSFYNYLQFIRENDIGYFSYTRASQSFSCYRYKYLYPRIAIHNHKETKELERLAYYGGRTEAFRIGKLSNKKYISLDINSMYPYVMKTYKMPTVLQDYVIDPSNKELLYFLKNFSCIAEVQIKTDEPCYCIRRKGKIIFPIGSFTTYLCTPGLLYAYHQKHIVKVKRISIYNQAKLFTSYVKDFYELKKKYTKENNQIYRNITKIFLNSLYGKFGQQREIESIIEGVASNNYYKQEIYDVPTNTWITHICLFNKMIIKEGKEDTNITMTAIPAHITEYARFELYKIMSRIGLKNVLYVDTDSVKFEEKHLWKVKDLIDDEKLGYLKIEERFNQFSIRGLKSYHTEHINKNKGVPKTAIQIDQNTFSYLSFVKQQTHMRKKISDHYYVRKIKKKLSGKYDKGIVHKNGNITPLILNE